jgi:hypothetical protein
MHTTAASVGQQDTHTAVPAHTRTCARAHTYKHKCACVYTQAHTHIHMHAHKTQAHTHIHTHVHAHTHSHAHMHIHYTYTRCARDGLRKFPASLAMLPHLSCCKLETSLLIEGVLLRPCSESHLSLLYVRDTYRVCSRYQLF